MKLANKPASLSPKRLSGEWLEWCQTKERIGHVASNARGSQKTGRGNA
jgi:hypothetical protein